VAGELDPSDDCTSSGEAVRVTVGSAGPAPGTRLYGAFAEGPVGFGCRSGGGPNRAFGVSSGHSSQSAADQAAVSTCNSVSRTGVCSVRHRFGSAYSGANDCGALAYGHTDQGGGACNSFTGTGNTRRQAEQDATASCRARGFPRCFIPTSDQGSAASQCSN